MIRIDGLPRKIFSKWQKPELVRLLVFIINYRHQIAVKMFPNVVIQLINEFFGDEKNQEYLRLLKALKQRFRKFDKIVAALARTVGVDESWVEFQKRNSKHKQASELIHLFAPIWNAPTFQQKCLEILQNQIDPENIRLDIEQMIFQKRFEQGKQNVIANDLRNIKLKPEYSKNNLKDTTSFLNTQNRQNSPDNDAEKGQISVQNASNQEINSTKGQKQRRKKRPWGHKKKLSFIVFLIRYKDIFKNKTQIFKEGIFNHMQNFVQNIKGKTSQHFYFDHFKEKEDIDKSIDLFLKSLFVTEDEVKKQVQRVQKLYEQDIKNQLNSVLITNFQVVEQIQSKENPQDFKIQCKKNHNEQQAIENEPKQKEKNMLIPIDKIEIPIKVQLFIQKKRTQSKQNEQKYEYLMDYNPNEAFNFIDSEEQIRNQNIAQQEIHKNQNQMEIEVQNFPQIPQPNSKIVSTYWTISQQMKYILFLLINQESFKIQNDYLRGIIWKQVSDFIGTDKSPHQCQFHFHYVKKRTKAHDLDTMIKVEASKFGITHELVLKWNKDKDKQSISQGPLSFRIQLPKTIKLKTNRHEKIDLNKAKQTAITHLKQLGIPIIVNVLFLEKTKDSESTCTNKDYSHKKLNQDIQSSNIQLEGRNKDRFHFLRFKFNYRLHDRIFEKYCPNQNGFSINTQTNLLCYI